MYVLTYWLNCCASLCPGPEVSPYSQTFLHGEAAVPDRHRWVQEGQRPSPHHHLRPTHWPQVGGGRAHSCATTVCTEPKQWQQHHVLTISWFWRCSDCVAALWIFKKDSFIHSYIKREKVGHVFTEWTIEFSHFNNSLAGRYRKWVLPKRCG